MTWPENLRKFVKNVSKHYGSEIESYNMHSVIHLNDNVVNLYPLHTFAALPFENYLQKVKRMLTKPNQPNLCNNYANVYWKESIWSSNIT